MENKRKASRYDCAVPVESKKGTAFDDSLTIDISSGGVGLILEKYIPIDTKMAVEIALTPEGDPFVTVGRVKWIRRLPDQQHYRVGMSFGEPPSALKSRINSHFK